MSSLPSLALLAIFLASAGVIWAAGIQLSDYTDVLAERLHLGAALGGTILLAQRALFLGERLEQVKLRLKRITEQVAAALTALKGVGPDVAATLLLAAGDNPERLANERSFASLCGVSPVQASSGKTHRHRLNRGGDRQANAALWRIALVRLNCDQRTKDYLAKRVSDGKSKTEAIRCLKRYIAREVFAALPAPAAT